MRWRCTGAPDYSCVLDPEGEFETLAACVAACYPYRYHCTGAPDYECVLDPDGEFATLEQCELLCVLPENTCNSCDPPIQDKLYVKFSGLGGELFDWNGKWLLNWHSECVWEYYAPGPITAIQLKHTSSHRDGILLRPSTGYQFRWKPGVYNACHPELSTFVFSYCVDYNGLDGITCGLSEGATAEVLLY
ncbi:hypothetical protein ES703_50858 [subsurface metagenome]